MLQDGALLDSLSVPAINESDYKLKFASLYSGCGGMDLGLISAGMQCIGAFDVDDSAVNNYQLNLGKHIQKHDVSQWTKGMLNTLRLADLVVAGPPCQGFSTAGKNNPDDPRNDHLLNVGLLAAETKPEMLLVENVRGLVGSRHNQKWLEFKNILANSGYKVIWKILDTNDYGVAQSRKRVIVVATRKVFFEFPDITLKRKTVLEDVLNGIKVGNNAHNPKFLETNSKNFKIASMIQPGQKLSNVRSGPRSVHTWDIPAVFGSISTDERRILETMLSLRRRERVRDVGDADPVTISSLIRDLPDLSTVLNELIAGLVQKDYLRFIDDKIDLKNTFNGKFRRLENHMPSLTVDTRFGQPRYFLHPYENRGFTVREAARIQSFPDNHQFNEQATTAFRLIGNAVPPLFAKHLGMALLNSFAIS